MRLFNFIKAANFFPIYANDVKDWKKKMTGKNGRGNPLEFSEEDKKIIKSGLKRFVSDQKDW